LSVVKTPDVDRILQLTTEPRRAMKGCASMAALVTNSKPAWQATLKWERHSVEQVRPRRRKPVVEPGVTEAEAWHELRAETGDAVQEEVERVTIRVCFVDFSRAGIDPIRFRVNALQDGRFTFSDPRGRNSGTAGTTGIWGTRPPTNFRVEAARLIGADRADQIVRQIMNHEFFSSYLRQL
jgi:hypothetical protein